jgi:adenine-specific DNA-methyltransferase
MELSSKLREIFQINRPELDFGIYRILNARSREIGEYLDRTLPEKVRAALSSGDATLTKQLQAELKDAEKSAQSLGLNPDVAPRVLELRAKLREGGASGAEHENAVFSHLLTFFSRYYDKGDFVSLRRYKGDTYSIPYSGEEVLLHWANKDQYYIKSGENFSNYSFSLEDGRRVHFRVLAADVAKDNRKDNDRDRCFVLAEKRVHTREDEAGDEIEEQVVPVEEVVNDGSSELIIRFVYATVPKGTRQDALLGESLRAISASDIVQRNWQGLMTPLPTEKNPQRTLLEKHLTDYTAKNTADYFIHKDLGAFLRRELDFYIKNEVLSLDDVQAAEVISDIDKRLRMIQCLRSIALEVIVFLSQLEDYQKRLWMKKKFVVGCHYCMTLDRVPKGLLQSVVSNRKQWDEWRRLGLWRKAGDGTAADLAAQPFMMVDSSLYDLDFVEKLLAGVDDLDEATDGLLIHSDNFQALNLIGERYRSKIDFIYIDPPYNTVHSKIAYKNQFEHSSWLALISNTIPLARRLLAPMYSFGFAIDDYEYNNAFLCLRDQFAGADVATVVIEHHPQGSGGRLSRTHEYYIVISPQNGPQYLGFPEEDETEDRSFMRSGTAENNFRAGRPRSFYALLIDPVTRKVVGVEPPPDRGANYPTGRTAEGLERKYPINEKGEERVWRSSYETGRQRVERGEIELTARGAVKQLIAHQDKRKTLMSTWKGAEFNAGTNGTAVLDNLGLGGVFDYPKSVKTLEQAFWMQSFGKVDFTVLDYFGGSGTTGHATLSLNRKDGKRR